MAESHSPESEFQPEDAKRFYDKGLELKAKGHFDAALTELRRALLADPNIPGVQPALASLYKIKADSDSRFLSYYYDAAKKSAHLDLTSMDAQNQYISASQRMGTLVELHEEYKNLAAQYPENEVLQRTLKNTTALMLALMPTDTKMGSQGGNAKLKTVFLVSAIGMFLLAGVLLMIPVMFRKSFASPESADTIRAIVRVGIGCLVVSGVSFIIRTRIK